MPGVDTAPPLAGPGAFSAPGGSPASPRGAGAFAAALLSGMSVLVALWPLSAVIQPGRWSLAAAGTATAVILAGVLIRRLLNRRPAVAIPVALVVAVLAGSVVLSLLEPRYRQAGFPLPDPGAIGLLLGEAGTQIARGVAPLPTTPELDVLVALGAGVLALLLDVLIAVLRVPLAAGLLIAGIGVIPATVVPGGGSPVWFVGLAIAVLLLLRVRIRPFRADPADPDATDTARTAPPARVRLGATVGIGAIAVVTALVVSPIVPLSSAGLDLGVGTRLDATLRLGDDLRRPTPTTALTLLTTASSAPYTRIATLSDFDGKEWRADAPGTAALGDAFGPVAAAEGVTVREDRTVIRTIGITGEHLPVPYQATAVRGLDGTWAGMPENRTVVAVNADAADQNYTVQASEVVPTAEQIQASTAAGSDAPAALRALPEGMPPVIAEQARTVVGAAATDYDRLIALQTWFRSGFRYSLETPVEEGFDGSGADAVARFLSVREGYCVHFAGAFALMARSLGMPTRIVVGYLPGSPTEKNEDGRQIYAVTSDQLHAWPEVYFQGLGWIPFEPTATRGVPTRFAAASTGAGGDGSAPSAGPTPAPTSSTATTAPTDRGDRDPGSAAPVAQRPLDPMPVLWTVLAVLLVLLLPAAARGGQRAIRMGRARRGDPGAAWAEIRDTLRDLGLPASGAESPRARGERLVRDRGADPGAVRILVEAVERASYAPDPASADASPELPAAVTRIRRDLLSGASGRDRALALLVPRSLLGARLSPSSVS